MAPASTVVAYDHGTYAIPAHVANLVAVPADHITIATVSTPTTPLTEKIPLGALPSHMPGYVAHVADRFMLTITCYVACFPAILACFVICAVSCNMPWLVAIVAES